MRRRIQAWILAPLVLATGPALAQEKSDYAAILERVGPAFVTVKFVLKMQGQFGNRESEAEVTGVMIDPSGLVLCGNTRLGSARMARSIGGSATPTDIKVLIGDDTEGLEARVLARDSELDLAWVQIKKPGDRKFVSLDLSKSAMPIPGERLLAVRKMAKYFDRALTVSEGRLAGKTHKPRDLLVPSGTLSLETGLPVFTASGDVVGISVLQMPEEDELQSMALTGIGRDISNGLVLPVAEVVRATARAKEVAAEKGDDDNDTPAKKSAKGEKSAKSDKGTDADKNAKDDDSDE
jgi:hypothetical protein